MRKTIFIDCTELVLSNFKTGIQRVERNIISSSLKACGRFNISVFPVAYLGKMAGLRKLKRINETSNFKLSYFENVYLCTLKPNRLKTLSKATFPFFSKWLDENWKQFRYLLLLLLIVFLIPISILSIIFVLAKKNEVKISENDIYFIPGSSWWAVDLKYPITQFRLAGAKVVVLLHDLIAVNHQEYCDITTVNSINSEIRNLIKSTDLMISVSKFTENELRVYIREEGIKVFPKMETNYSGFKLDLIENNSTIRPELIQHVEKSYIAIGTVEPRKNYVYLLDAFDLLWESDFEISLCIIGKYGWKSDAIIKRIHSHPLFDKHLFWYEDLNDRELLYSYEHAKACVYPSIVEGFGLPLIEALSIKCPVLVSDIPVFHEVGGQYCHYFSLENPSYLSELVVQIEKSALLDNLDYLDSFSWPDWNQSTSSLLTKIMDI